MPDLGDLVRAAVSAAEGDEAVEAYAEESRQTEASALRGEVEGLEFAESRGVGVRVIRRRTAGLRVRRRPDASRRCARRSGRARENAALAEPDEFNVLPPGVCGDGAPGAVRQGLRRRLDRGQGADGAGPGGAASPPPIPA